MRYAIATRLRPGRRTFLRAAVTGATAAVTRPLLADGAPADDPITAVTLIHGIPGREHELKAHLLSLTVPTRAEAGCLRYDLYQSPDRKHEFMRFEMWTSAEALEAHKQTPPLRASFAKRQREGWTTEIVIWDRVPD